MGRSGGQIGKCLQPGGMYLSLTLGKLTRKLRFFEAEAGIFCFQECGAIRLKCKAGGRNMFGYVTINKPEIRFKDYDMYRSYYCGLCRDLGAVSYTHLMC